RAVQGQGRPVRERDGPPQGREVVRGGRQVTRTVRGRVGVRERHKLFLHPTANPTERFLTLTPTLTLPGSPMDAQKLKAERAQRRRFRVRRAIYGTPQKPRLSVFRSNLHIYAQLIDDLNGVTIAAASSAGKDTGLKHGANVKAAAEVGKKLAEAAKAKGIT